MYIIHKKNSKIGVRNMNKKRKIIILFSVIALVCLLVAFGVRLFIVMRISSINKSSRLFFEEEIIKYKEPENPQNFDGVQYDLIWGLHKNLTSDTSFEEYTNDNGVVFFCSSQSNVVEAGSSTEYSTDIEKIVYSSDLEVSLFDPISDLFAKYAIAGKINELSEVNPNGSTLYVVKVEDVTMNIIKQGNGAVRIGVISKDKNSIINLNIIDNSNSLSMDDLFDFASRVSFTYEE